MMPAADGVRQTPNARALSCGRHTASAIPPECEGNVPSKDLI